MNSSPAPHHASPLSPVAVLIPAWRPPESLQQMVVDLRGHGFGSILLVDDGSGPQSHDLFESLQTNGISLLRHSTNLGKGRALKTGFNAVVREYPGLRCVVTADADGQHTVQDIVRVAEAWLESGRPVLGSRTLGSVAPWRSRFGNAVTRSLFGLLSGTTLRDTQTGLRALPVELLPELLELSGERYEYEMAMLAHLCREAQVPLEIEIQTVYFDSNRESKFKPVRDSLRIYRALLRSTLEHFRRD